MNFSVAPPLTRKDLQAFLEVASVLSSGLGRDDTLRAILRPLELSFQPEETHLFLLDEPGRALFSVPCLSPSFLVPLDGSPAGQVLRDGEPFILLDAASPSTGDPLRTAHGSPVQTIACFPVAAGTRTLGVLQLLNAPAACLAPAHHQLLRLAADYCAIAIENDRTLQRIHQLTITDDSTGLLNQRHLYRILEEEVRPPLDSATRFSLIFIDLDHFKRVNERHGHLVGSRVLGEFGRTLRSLVRAEDAVFRYGGDEFVVLLRNTGRIDAKRVARELHQALRARAFPIGEDLTLSLRASYGVATWPDDATGAEDLIRRADRAMYRVKGTTRDAVASADF